MDAHEESTRKGDEKTGYLKQTNGDATAIGRHSIASRTSQDSYDSALGDDADVDDLDPLNNEMDNAEVHRRRKAQLAAKGAHGERNGSITNKASLSNGMVDYPSRSGGDDIEMEEIDDEEGLSDDEETGLTKIDKRRRKRRRRTTTDLDARIGGSAMTADQEQKLADKAVWRALVINVILIASWYFFSLSLSIVSEVRRWGGANF